MRLNGIGFGVCAVLGVVASVTSAMAGDHGCRSAECYERVRRPDVYATVARPVVIAPGHVDVVRHPPVVIENVRRIETVPGQFHVQHSPAMYGSYTRTVMVSPARTVHQHVPAVRQIVHRHEIVRAASYRWERTVDAHGRVTMCKVGVPQVTRTVAREVVVAPAQTVALVVPAQYRQISQPMLVAPARRHFTYQPPAYAYVSEPMVVRPATQSVIHHPPVMGVQHQEVLVQRGGYGWAPVGRHY